MKIKKHLGVTTLVGIGILGASSAQAVEVQWTSAILSNPLFDVGSSSHQYTGNDTVSKITATSWNDDTFATTGPNLYGKNGGANETGLGLVNARASGSTTYTNNEIEHEEVIRIDLTAIKNSWNSFSFQTGSTQNIEHWQVWGSNSGTAKFGERGDIYADRRRPERSHRPLHV
jgi:hypothetical protein